MQLMNSTGLTLTGLVIFLAASGARAELVDFETKEPFYCEFANQTDNGLSFSHDFAACFYGPSPNNADFPTEPPSVVMGIGYSDIAITRVDGLTFNLFNLDLAFGPFGHGGLLTDTTAVTGFLAGGGTISTTLTVGYDFANYALNWTGLTSVVFGELQASSEYLTFDNIEYNTAQAVPEPGTLFLLGLGLAAMGFARRGR